MDTKQYFKTIKRGHFLYWDMLSNLRGIKKHNEGNMRWLSGHINYNYFADAVDMDNIIKRMKKEEIPPNLLFLVDNPNVDPTEPFIASGMFKKDSGTTGMAHELDEIRLPRPDSRINLFRIREISQLKAAGAILNAAFGYNLFPFTFYLDMMENDGQFFYLAEYDGLPVGAVMSQHGDNFLNISWVGTLPGYRKLGIAGYLIQMAEYDGALRGKTIGVLHGYPEAVGAYRRIGYRAYSHGIGITLTSD